MSTKAKYSEFLMKSQSFCPQLDAHSLRTENSLKFNTHLGKSSGTIVFITHCVIESKTGEDLKSWNLKKDLMNL